MGKEIVMKPWIHLAIGDVQETTNCVLISVIMGNAHNHTEIANEILSNMDKADPNCDYITIQELKNEECYADTHRRRKSISKHKITMSFDLMLLLDLIRGIIVLCHLKVSTLFGVVYMKLGLE